MYRSDVHVRDFFSTQLAFEIRVGLAIIGMGFG